MDSSDISVLTMIMGYLMGTNIFGPVVAVHMPISYIYIVV